MPCCPDEDRWLLIGAVPELAVTTEAATVLPLYTAITCNKMYTILNEPRCEKTGLRGF